ncbi:hypothetical protein [Solibacillus sp. R5-41]
MLEQAIVAIGEALEEQNHTVNIEQARQAFHEQIAQVVKAY